MNMRKTAGIGAAVLIGGAVLGAVVLRMAIRNPEIQARLVTRMVNSVQDKAATRAAMVDAQILRVVLCGTASPLPNKDRAGPCAAVMAAGQLWLVDAGGGGWKNLQLWQMPGAKLRGVLLTHFHSDHIQDLGDINLESWVAGRPAQLQVYGGPGVEQVVGGFNMAYTLDSTYRMAHHGTQLLPAALFPMAPHAVATSDGKPLAEGARQDIYDQDGMKIAAIGVNHSPVSPAYAYQFTYQGRSVVISGDTRYSPGFATAVAGVDVIVHEAQATGAVAGMQAAMHARGNDRIAKIMHDIQTYHTTPQQAAQVANTAGAKLLLLTHLTPPAPGMFAKAIFLDPTLSVRPSGTLLGYDGLMVSLPAAGGEDISNLN